MEAPRTGVWSSTITLPPTPQTHLTLRSSLNQNVETPDKLSSLIENMLDSELFSIEEVAGLIELDLTSEEQEKKEEAARYLCFFLIENVRSKIVSEQSVECGKKLLEFEDEIKDILRQLLSDQVDVDRFIEDCEEGLDEESFKIESAELLNHFKTESDLLEHRCLALARLTLETAASTELENQKAALLESKIHKAALERVFSRPLTKMNLLLEQMKRSPLFSTIKMSEWELKLRQLNLSTEIIKEKEDNGLVICLFLFELIRPPLLATQDSAMKQKLLAFENTVKVILGQILPPNQDVEKFIEQFEGYLDKEAVLKQKFDLLLSSFQAQIKQFILSANQTNQQINQNCQILKQRLNEVNEMRHVMSEDVFKKFDSLTERVGQLLDKTKENGKSVQGLSEHMQSEDQEFKQILATCETILKKV